MLYERAARAEEDLRKSEARFRALVDQSLVAVAELDLDGNYTLANARFCQMSGYSEAELLTRNVRDLVHPDDLPRSLEEFTQVVTAGTPAQAEKRLVRKDGSLVWISDGMSVIRDGNDEKHCVAMVATDITERKQAEAVLRENEERLRLAVEAGHIGTCDWNYQNGEMLWNAARFQMYGLEPQQRLMHYEDFLAAVHPDDRERVGREVHSGIKERGEHREEYRVLQPGGSVR